MKKTLTTVILALAAGLAFGHEGIELGPNKGRIVEFSDNETMHGEVTVKDGVAHCTSNGEVLEAALPMPATGPIGLEGDRGQMEYRRIRIRE